MPVVTRDRRPVSGMRLIYCKYPAGPMWVGVVDDRFYSWLADGTYYDWASERSRGNSEHDLFMSA